MILFMKPFRFTALFLALGLPFLISCLSTEIEAAQPLPDPFQSYLRVGIEKTLNLEIPIARESMQKAVELDRENPTGYAFFAFVELFSYEMSFEQKDREKHQADMLRYVSETLIRGEKRIEKSSKDGQAYFAMALAKIVKVRWAIEQKNYFIIVQETSDILDYCEKVKKENPNHYDIYFLTGLLHYHIAHLPALSRFFSSLLITSGNHQGGLQELELAAHRGDLLKEFAQAELSSVYEYFEKKPEQALPIIRGLKEKFPLNYRFLFTLAGTLSDLDRFDEAFATTREIEKGFQVGKSPFVHQLRPRFDQLMGHIYFDQKEYAKAADYFQRALKDTAAYNARTRASALTGLGMIHDVRKERKQAEDYYSRALQVKGGEGAAQVEAKQYLKTPYVPLPKH
jgi:tetratricopeptide (TPR) repeat protein